MIKNIRKTVITISILSTTFAHPAFAGMQKAYAIYQNKLMPGTEKLERITYELMESRYYFAASVMASKRLEREAALSPRFKSTLEELSIKVGVDFFGETLIHANHRDPTISFAQGLKYFRLQNYHLAKEHLQFVGNDNKYFPESAMILGTILSLEQKDQSAKEKYNLCIQAAKREEKNSENPKQARYYALIAGDCQINMARDLYRKGSFHASIEEYDKIPKNSYRWPYLLLEKAWAHYQLKDYNRSLGLLVTYKSPLLESYFFPEAEALTALSYYQLCLWQDTEVIINRYYSDYRNKAADLKKYLDLHKATELGFYQLASEKITNENQVSYAQSLLMQVKKQIKYSLDILPIQRAEMELAQLHKLEKNIFTDFLTKKVDELTIEKKKRLNKFIAHSMIDFLNQIHRYSRELFVIQLEMLAQKRTLLYQEEKLISNRSRGDLSNVKRKSTQHFWHFSGAFWADELGEYSFGLKSNCQRVGEKKDEK